MLTVLALLSPVRVFGESPADKGWLWLVPVLGRVRAALADATRWRGVAASVPLSGSSRDAGTQKDTRAGSACHLLSGLSGSMSASATSAAPIQTTNAGW